MIDGNYRVPNDLQRANFAPRRALGIGTCLLRQGIISVFPRLQNGCPVDHVLFNHVQTLPEVPPRPIEEYDFQVVQIPFPSLFPDHAYTRIPFSDPAAFERMRDDAVARLGVMLESALGYTERYGLPAFVLNFQVFQQNPLGRLMPRYDVRNLMHLVEQINAALEVELQRYKGAYMIDFDSLCATYGRRYFQDDALYGEVHLGALGPGDLDFDTGRLKTPTSATEFYPVRLHDFYVELWEEILGAYRTIKGMDSIKLAVFDLDDTLWRGVVAEDSDVPPEVTLGWPKGVAEAALMLKQRGVMLAIISKNDDSKIANIWDKIWKGYLKLDDFAIRRINWQPKADNMAEVLGIVNVLPSSVLFVDDNPVEREAIKAAFPSIRVIGEEPYLVRRILLWSPETQVAHISDESSKRTMMMQSQVEREEARSRMSREEFLEQLNVRVEFLQINSADHPRFDRAFELLNKTNQFNTTGRRWTRAELDEFFRSEGEIVAWDVKDKFTEYGLVGVAMLRSEMIEQFVMSCRVLGLGVEGKALQRICAHRASQGKQHIAARLVKSEVNFPCHALYADFGFVGDDSDEWRMINTAMCESTIESAQT